MEIKNYNAKYHAAVLKLHELALKQSQYAKNSWSPQWDGDLQKIEETYLDDRGAFLLWLLGSKLIGMGALLKVDGNTAKIKRIRVHPDYQRKGLSSEIMGELERKARELGYRKLIADTAKGNLPAEKMLLKVGFKPVEDRNFDGVLCTIFEKELARKSSPW